MTGVCGYKESSLGFDDMSAGLRLILSLLFGSDTPTGNKVIPFERSAANARANDQAEILLDRYGGSILRLAYSYLHNMSDAEDVLQDALIQFIKALPQFETPDHEKAWLMRVAINLSKNRIKYLSLRKADELYDSLAAREEDDLKFVWDAVKSLPACYSEVIHLYYHEGYSTAQIAGLLSKNESTVRSLLKRAREKLKAVLKEVYDF